MLKIIDSSGESLQGKPPEVTTEETLSLYDAGLGDIFTLVGKSHLDPFDALIEGDETVIKMYRNYSLALFSSDIDQRIQQILYKYTIRNLL